MNEFKTYHPIVNFFYFLFVIGFSMFLMHPFCLAVSLLCAFTYSVLLKGTRAVKANLMYMLPMLLIAALMNPAFSHEGVTILTYLPSGNPLTLESIVYGAAAAVMIVSVICWFSCYNEIMTSDKFVYLFGRILPSLSLLLSMTFRFVPKFAAQMKTVTRAQQCMGRDPSSGTVLQRAKHGLSILSVLITWALENAVETADSMKSRGYGQPGRTSFSIFTFDRRDGAALCSILLLGLYTLCGAIGGKLYFRYFPSVKTNEITLFGCSVFAAYFLLCLCPIIIECWEALKWNSINSKI